MANGVKKGAAQPALDEKAEPAIGLPLFFQKPAALEKNRHANATLKTKPMHGFARSANSIALNALEFIEAGKHYPIVFTSGEDAAALAILGLEKTNYFVDAEGNWLQGAYIPAYVHQYPFVFFEDVKQKKFFLCIDEQSPQFSASGVEGEEGTARLFNDDGTPSPITNQALEFCNTYYKHHAITRNFNQDLRAHNLLAPHKSSLTLKSGRVVTLSGFSMVDEKAFNALPDEVVLEFRKKGWLAFIYLALASASNWKRIGDLAEQSA